MPRALRPLLVATALFLVVAADATAAYTIRANRDGFVKSIGPLRVAQDATLARATDVFGMPTRIAPVGDGSEACRVQWRALRLRALFANFGIDSACEPRAGLLQTATIRSREFRTRRDLRVGDRSSSIKRKHPEAEFRDNVWWIRSAFSPAADMRIPTIEAIVKGGRVEVLRLWVGAAGD